VQRARARYTEENPSLPWFRWKKSKQQVHDDATSDVAPTDLATPAEPASPAAAPASSATEAAATGDGEQAKKKRRRGSRGGRGRKKPGAASAAEGGDEGQSKAEPEAAASGASGRAKSADSGQQRSQRSERRANRPASGARRRQQQRRAPLPAAKRELVISIDIGEQRVAILEDDRVAEVYLERPERRSIAGNIYLGVVDNVLPGMEAAFVEIGLEKNGFLYVDEIVGPELEGRRHGRKIQDLISRGEQLLVQAVKDPMKTKGARLTTEISLPGRFLVYVPNGEGLGVSRRLDDDERARLKEIIKALDVSEGGVIVRTAAEGASEEDIERDFVFLQRLWKGIQARAKGAAPPSLVYQEAELPLRIVRDLFAGDFVSAYVDNERGHKRIVGYLKKTSPHMIERVHRYKEKEPLFERYGVGAEIESTLNRRVDLPSGGYLIFDYAEAFTVVDVNTGRFVGSRSKSSTQRLEDTITKNNLEAVKEVVRQLRLRDIGGIIVIDFIDMANPKNRAAVEDALRTELERDRTKTYVVEISPLGLVEMTRQNVTDGPREILTRKCPTCAGDGIVVSDHTVALDVERKLRGLVSPGNRVQAYRIGLHPRILALVAGPGGERLAAIEEASRRRFFLVEGDGHIHTDQFEVLAEGKLADLQPTAPFAEGAQVELKLAEIARYDATAASGTLDGVEIVVADAAKRVGKKAKVVVGRVLEGQAFATLADGATPEEPITFESEAEKPTRAPAKRKVKAGAEPAGPGEASAAAEADRAQRPDEATEPDEVGVAEPAEPDDVPDAAAASEEAQGEEPKPKKKTRRGSRGGKRRKKTPAAAAVTDGESSDGDASADAGEAAPATPRKRSPRIHVPASDDAPERDNGDVAVAPEPSVTEAPTAAGADPASDGEGNGTPKKKTRRGTRGGRNRRKSTAAASAVDGGGDLTPDDSGQVPERGEASAQPVGDRTGSTGDETVPTGAPAPVGVAEKDDDGSGDEGYVPMSEWLDDFSR
jgi:ribonuclease G